MRTPNRDEMAGEQNQVVIKTQRAETVVKEWLLKWKRKNAPGMVFIVQDIPE